MENKLTSTTDFVLKIVPESEIDDTRLLDIVLKHATFLKQPLTLGMIVPCGDEGNILKEPAYYSEWLNDEEFIFTIDGIGAECRKYHEAKEKVLFKGFEYSGNWSGFWQLNHSSGREFLVRRSGTQPIESLITKEIEIELTESALKKIGLP